jgi:hypothetical protein
LIPKEYPGGFVVNLDAVEITDFRAREHDEIDSYLIDAVSGRKDDAFVKYNFIGTKLFKKTVVEDNGLFKISWVQQTNITNYNGEHVVWILIGGSMTADTATDPLPAIAIWGGAMNGLHVTDFIL